MNIHAKNGHKVICSTHDAGYDPDEERARKYLTVGDEYTIERTVVHSWFTDVYLQEFPEISFNSVFFEDAVKEPITTWLWWWGVDQNDTSKHSPKIKYSSFETMKLKSAKHSADYQWVGEGYWSNYEKVTE